jgi:hypothetical protein
VKRSASAQPAHQNPYQTAKTILFNRWTQLPDSFRINIRPTNPVIMVSRAHLQNIQRLQTQQKQQARSLTIMQQPATLALSLQQLPMIQPPLNVDVNPLLEQTVLAMQHEYTPDSSNDIYNNKTKEYFQYGDCCYPFDHYNKVLDANKLKRFMFIKSSVAKRKGGETRDSKSDTIRPSGLQQNNPKIPDMDDRKLQRRTAGTR